MRVGFAGTPAFAVAALDAIAAAGFDIPLVLTRPDRPKGRGLALQPSAVKEAALRLGLPVRQPASLKGQDVQAELMAIPLDVLVVAAYGLILPPPILSWPRHGALNIHASLLPRWRGAAPIARAILAGDAETGITIMQMDAGLDTGGMILQTAVPIAPHDTAATLHDALANVGSQAIVEVLARLRRDGRLVAAPQPEGATYAAKLERAEGAIEWAQGAADIDRRVRAFDPWPGAFTALRGEPWKIWRTEPLAGPHDATPGTVLRSAGDAIEVACGSGVLRIHELQPAGGKRLPGRAWLSGRRIAPGDVFAAAPP